MYPNCVVYSKSINKAWVYFYPVSNFLFDRVRTGYGILEKLWNFEKEIPYMEKLWNFSKTVVPMEKLWNFFLVEKSACFHYVRTSKRSFNVCCLCYHFTRPSSKNLHFTRPSSKNLPGYTASLGRVNTC